MMRAVPLTPREAVALVARQVQEFEAAGFTHDAALLAVLLTLRIEPHKAVVLARPAADADE
jgi:hypothetical protein